MYRSPEGATELPSRVGHRPPPLRGGRVSPRLNPTGSAALHPWLRSCAPTGAAWSSIHLGLVRGAMKSKRSPLPGRPYFRITLNEANADVSSR